MEDNFWSQNKVPALFEHGKLVHIWRSEQVNLAQCEAASRAKFIEKKFLKLCWVPLSNLPDYIIQCQNYICPGIEHLEASEREWLAEQILYENGDIPSWSTHKITKIEPRVTYYDFEFDEPEPRGDWAQGYQALNGWHGKR